MKVLVAIQGRHPYTFGDKCVLPPVVDFCLNKITAPEPDIFSFEQFLIQCMVLVKSVLECKEYKPSLTGRVMDDSGVTLEQMKKNISNVVGGVVSSLLPKERIILLCNVLIRRYWYSCFCSSPIKLVFIVRNIWGVNARICLFEWHILAMKLCMINLFHFWFCKISEVLKLCIFKFV